MCLTPIKLGKVAKPLKISGSTRLMDLGSGVVTESYKVKPPRLIPDPLARQLLKNNCHHSRVGDQEYNLKLKKKIIFFNVRLQAGGWARKRSSLTAATG